MTRLIREPELAAKLGCRPNTLAKYRIRGTGPRFIKLGNRIAYDPADVDEWLERQKMTSTSDAA